MCLKTTSATIFAGQRDRSKEDYWKKKLGVNAAAKKPVEPEVVVNTVAPPPKKTPTTSAGPAHFSGMTYEKLLH